MRNDDKEHDQDLDDLLEDIERMRAQIDASPFVQKQLKRECGETIAFGKGILETTEAILANNAINVIRLSESGLITYQNDVKIIQALAQYYIVSEAMESFKEDAKKYDQQ